MAQEVDIGGSGALFIGEDKTILIEVLDVNGVPVDMTSPAPWTLHFVVRTSDAAADPPLFDKTASVTGAYNVNRTQNLQRASITFTHAELLTLPNKRCRHSLARTDTAAETVIVYGDFAFQKATAL